MPDTPRPIDPRPVAPPGARGFWGVNTPTDTHGTLHDYDTGEALRPATAEEAESSREAASRDGGAGVITVDGVRCYGEPTSGQEHRMTTTTTTTYTKGGLGCCLTFTLDGQPRAIDGDVGAHAYDQVDDIEWVGPPERVGDHPPVYRRGATTSSLRPLKSRPVEADDPIAVLRARDRGATTLSEVVGEMMASR